MRDDKARSRTTPPRMLRAKSSREALADLERAVRVVFENAEATLGGVGFACFLTPRKQDEAFAKAKAKLHEARILVQAVERFKAGHGDFN